MNQRIEICAFMDQRRFFSWSWFFKWWQFFLSPTVFMSLTIISPTSSKFSSNFFKVDHSISAIWLKFLKHVLQIQSESNLPLMSQLFQKTIPKNSKNWVLKGNRFHDVTYIAISLKYFKLCMFLKLKPYHHLFQNSCDVK